MPEWLKWTIGGGVTAASIVLTLVTGGAASGTILASVHAVATGVMIGSIASATTGAVFGDGQWSAGGYVVEALQGAVQGISTFKIAKLGGQIGLFNNLANLPTPDVFFSQYGGMNLLRSIAWGQKF